MPCDAAPTRSGTAWASAPRHTSATRWLTSTLPAPTAAGAPAATSEPAGARISTGRRAPALAGTSRATTVRRAKTAAATVTASTALTLPDDWEAVPAKSNRMPSPSTVIPTPDDRRTLKCRIGSEAVEHVLEEPVAVRQLGQGGAHPPFAVVEHLAEGRLGQIGEAAHPENVGPDLGIEVAAALRGRARVGGEQRPDPVVDENRREPETLVEDLRRVGRHRSGGATAEVGVVGPVGRPPTIRPSTWQGATRVTSLRWLPPRNGSFTMIWSPRPTVAPSASFAERTAAGMAPRCTGMCSACTSRSPRRGEQGGRRVHPLLDVGTEGGASQHLAHPSVMPESRAIKTCSDAGSSSPDALQHQRAGLAGPSPPPLGT